MKLETERFKLRKLTSLDATETYLSWFYDPLVNVFIESKPQKTAELAAFIEEKNNQPSALLLGIFTKDNRHIGNIKFEPINPDKHYAALGILIGDPEWRGKGLSQEVIPACCYALHQSHAIAHFCLGVLKDNFAAIRAYEKIGFIRSQADIRETMYVMDLFL